MEFTVHFDSRPGLADEDRLERFQRVMDEAAALGPATGLHADGGFAAAFQVEQATAEEAARVGALLFRHGMREVGIAEPLVELDRIEVELDRESLLERTS